MGVDTHNVACCVRHGSPLPRLLALLLVLVHHHFTGMLALALALALVSMLATLVLSVHITTTPPTFNQ